MNSIGFKTKELSRYYGCHGNIVNIATRYVANVYCPKEASYSIRLKTNELLTYHNVCHSNLLTIATRYVADAYYPVKASYHV